MSSDDDDLPAWAKSYSPPVGKTKSRLAVLEDSDSEAEQRRAGERPSTSRPVHAHAKAAAPSGPQDEINGTSAAAPSTWPKQPRSAAHTRVAADDAAAAAPSPARAAQAATNPAAAIAAAAAEPSGTQPSTQQAGTQPPLGALALPAIVAEPLAKGTIALMMPERLPATKVLLELRATEQSQAADLTGDAGSVGRVVAAKKEDGDEFKIDLKGVLYNTSVLPLAGTAMVVNLVGTDAKVEGVMHDFVRLSEEFLLGMEALEGNLCDMGDGSDDEVYQVDNDDAVVGEGSAKASGANTGKKPGAGAKSAAVRGSGAGRKLSASGGVKKTLAKRAGSSAVKKKKPAGRGSAKKPAKKPAKASADKATTKAPKAKPAAKKKEGSSDEDEEMSSDDGTSEDADDDDYSE